LTYDGEADAGLRPRSVQSRRAPNAGDGRGYPDGDALGFGRAEIEATIRTMHLAQFYKSMTSYGDHRIWQDVYHVPSPAGTLYVKFTADAVAEFALLSFKERDNG
jgi:motility quorum-sensing regulator/GCU-specific mRNA interferase toxin